MPLPATKPRLAEGERVLCYHGPLLYEAKLLRCGQLKEKAVRYLVHYSGWNNKWDEWVAESRVLKYNEDALKKQKELKQQHQLNRKAGRKKDSKDEKKEPLDCPVPVNKRKKGARQAGTGASDSAPSHVRYVDVKINIPQDLRRFLLDDCDFVTRQKQLVPIPKPAELTVRGICDSFVKHSMDSTEVDANMLESTLSEVSDGVCLYFNVMLGSHLLYKFERAQYAELLREHPGTPLCEMYGCEHLLRLFVKLGKVLSFGSLDGASATFVVSRVHELLDYVTKRADELFAAEYDTATPDYHRNSAE